MYRFFEKESSLRPDHIIIEGENFNHLVRVLRIKEDEDFQVIIGERLYLCQIEEVFESSLKARIKEEGESHHESPLDIHLYQSLPKSDKLEMIIQKTVELGVKEIHPFSSKYTIVKLDGKKTKKRLERWNNISHAAAKQSKRDYIPTVREPISFHQLLKNIEGENTLIAYEVEGEDLRKSLQSMKGEKINLIIGPEGGFAPEEVEAIIEAGAKPVNLGKRILRAETAAITMAAITQYELGDL